MVKKFIKLYTQIGKLTKLHINEMLTRMMRNWKYETACTITQIKKCKITPLPLPRKHGFMSFFIYLNNLSSCLVWNICGVLLKFDKIFDKLLKTPRIYIKPFCQNVLDILYIFQNSAMHICKAKITFIVFKR